MKASSSFPWTMGKPLPSRHPMCLRLQAWTSLIDSDGTFYPVRASDGSINQTIRIDLKGTYTFAVRNNSSYEVPFLDL